MILNERVLPFLHLALLFLWPFVSYSIHPKSSTTLSLFHHDAHRQVEFAFCQFTLIYSRTFFLVHFSFHCMFYFYISVETKYHLHFFSFIDKLDIFMLLDDTLFKIPMRSGFVTARSLSLVEVVGIFAVGHHSLNKMRI